MGIVYLIQPTELIGTDRYKIGCSRKSDLSRINTGYHKGTTPDLIEVVDEPFDVEKRLKKSFADRFALVAGTEYFAGNVADMKRCFKCVTTGIDISVGEAEVAEEAPVVNDRQCPKCSKVFSRKDSLKRHQAKCDGYEKNQCKICLKTFSTRRGKWYHVHHVKCSPPS